MKRTFFLYFALLGLLAVVMSSCSNDDEKNGGLDFVDGIVAPPYAASNNQWLIENEKEGIRQIWSAPIEVPACNKTTFDGGRDNPKADCRNNPSSVGYFYSWNYVNENADTLCPSPWRVPSKDDFIDLDKALGGNGDYSSVATERYTSNRWGGIYGGYAGSSSLEGQNSYGFNWSSTMHNKDSSFCQYYYGRYVYPQHESLTSYGYQARCVR